VALAIVLAAGLAACALAPKGGDTRAAARALRQGLDLSPSCAEVRLRHPLPDTVVPWDLAAPQFIWDGPAAGSWLVEVTGDGPAAPLYLAAGANPWEPSRPDWERMKAYAPGEAITVRVWRIEGRRAVSRAETRLTVAREAFAARVVYQEIPVPFKLAVAHPQRSRWRTANLAAYDPPDTLLADLPYCANCHTFSGDGRVFGLDMDYRGDRGGYVLSTVAPRLGITGRDIISWNDLRRGEGEVSRGLFAKISPRGDYVAATVKERPFLVRIDDPAYSQLFFPLSGQLAVYSRAQQRFAFLPGADDPTVVQTSPAWSPDGETIVFARGRAPASLWQALGDRPFLDAPPGVDIHTLNRRHPMRFDLWTVPFNGGRGGVARPLKGAVGGGASHYFPRYSPDGRWIVFCRAETGLVSQPGSRLVMIPAGGGAAREMRCNRPELNSWHSFAPNGRWMVFSSKPEGSPFTRVYLTHIDPAGQDAPALLLHRLGTPGMAAILPEAVAWGPQSPRSAALLEP